jgi:hypothetical protein
MSKEVYDPTPDMFSYDNYRLPWQRGTRRKIIVAGHGRSDFCDPMELVEFAINEEGGTALFYETQESSPCLLHLFKTSSGRPTEYLESYESIRHFAHVNGQPAS